MTPEIQRLQQQLWRAPQDPALHYELGRCYLALKQAELAQRSFAQALQLAPGHPQILMQLGNTASQRGDEELAADYFKQSLQQDNQQADVHFNLANSLRKLGLNSLAIQHFQQALALDPADAETHNNVGNAYRETGQLDLAVAAYAQALKQNPQLLHAKVHWIHQKQHMADWQGIDHAIDEVRTALKQRPQAQIPPFAFLAMPGTSSAEQLQCASVWAQQHYGHIQPLPVPAARRQDQKIRLAYISSDFRQHPLAYLVTDVIAAHDRSRFEVSLYSQARDDGSSEREAFMSAADHWIEIAALNDAAVAAHIRAADIDYLIDLTGFTQNSRSGVAAYRPARCHINWLGYPGSMGEVNGNSLFDVILVDETVQQAQFSERTIPLPCYQPNNAQRPQAEAGTRAQHGLPERGFVFCSFNQSFKITADVFACWMRILQQVPDSVLWLQACNPWATSHLKQAAQLAGVQPERLIFAPRTSVSQHIARQQHADLMLDTSPYNAHTTASDALWQGIPLLTVAGETFPARVSASLLKHIGLAECICDDWAQLEKQAIALANAPAALQALQIKVKQQAKMLFDPLTFCQQLEQVYRQLLQ
ncbi:MAG: O-linked N-acetylglucosamine transferase, SPINDLY family protein [Methylophilus sp.]|uniref:O-linked N-acetylglucosamine transferase, SPINDLY family protein n=1 Tax=Methylophilus sp. TaxID=29541 RepID=UPI003F9F216F